MPEFTNPYSTDEVREESPGEMAQRLAGYGTKFMSAFMGVHFTQDEQHALAKVIHAVMSEHPWLEDLPGVKK
jgi:hypothetical protein